jgi:hypothetical protein
MISSSGAQRAYAALRKARPQSCAAIDGDTLIFDLKAVDLQEVPMLARTINEVMSHGL